MSSRTRARAYAPVVVAGVRVHGAYGLALDGLHGPPQAAGLVPLDGPDWPCVTVVRECRPLTEADLPDNHIGEDVLEHRLLYGGYVHVDRGSRVARFVTPVALDDAELMHPFLAPVGAIWSRWLGREAFHGGGVVVDGGVWVLVGDKQAGKSTLAAWLAAAGHQVWADDLVVVEVAGAGGARTYPGPRTVDLRPATARRLDGRAELQPVRFGERYRLRLGPVTACELPLRGFVVVGDGDEVAVSRVPPGERSTLLSEHRVVRLLPRDPVGLLDLVALPVLRLTRPRRWEAMDGAVEALVEAVGGA